MMDAMAGAAHLNESPRHFLTERAGSANLPRRRPSTMRPLGACALSVAAALMGCVLFASFGGVFVQAALIVLTAFVLALPWRTEDYKGDIDYRQPSCIFSFFYGIFYVSGPAAQLLFLNREDNFTQTLIRHEGPEALRLILLGCSVVIFSYYLLQHIHRGERRHYAASDGHFRTLLAVGWVVLAVGLAVYFLTWRAKQGMTPKQAGTTLGRIPEFVGNTLPSTILFVLWYIHFRKKPKISVYQLLVAYTLVVATKGWLKTSSKYLLIAPVYAAFFPFWLARARVNVKLMVSIALLVVFVAYPIVMRFRPQAFQGPGTTYGEWSKARRDTFAQLDSVVLGSYGQAGHHAREFVVRLGGLRSMCGVLRVRRQGTGELGNAVYQWFAAFIPRWIWHGKPIISRGGKFCAVLQGIPFSEATSSTAITFMGDCVLTGGILGLVIGAGLLGLVLSWVGIRFVPPGPMSVGMVLFYQAVVLKLVQVEMEIPSTGLGTFMGVAAATIIYVAVRVRPRQASTL